MLKAKYQSILTLGEELGIRDGYVNEEAGKLKIGGTASYQYDADRLWDKIKEITGWENELEVMIQIANKDIYGVYRVQSGDTLSRISKQLFGDANRYRAIFELNSDTLDNPDLIKVGQDLKLPVKK